MSHVYSKVADIISEDSLHLLHTTSSIAGSLPIRIIACGHYFCLQGYRVERRGLDHRILLITLAGQGLLYYRGVQLTVEAGDAFIIDCSELHMYECTGDNWETKWVRFEELPHTNYETIINKHSIQLLPFSALNNVEEQIDLILSLATHYSIHSDLKMTAALTDVLATLHHNVTFIPTSKLSDSIDKTIADSVDYIHQHYMEQLTVQQLAQVVHLSTYAFIRAFKRKMGLTPYEYISQFRITKARYYLEKTTLSIGEITELIGYQHMNTFIRQFKLLTHMTPTKYRQLMV
ncbi:helix-turn-helix domain-containing protein [Paenibacillus yanchengensis]|uniref:Helix-turn-helix domain-containing protein n=1 Tax=Paenibacillus yanchengensis TaxID=2035833 RepID=A0ABW4YNJ1_9BACL